VSADKLSALQKFYPTAEALMEGGQLMAHLPGMKIDTPGGTLEINALLCPHEHSGYRTRLFFDRQIGSPRPLNWTSHSLGGKSWWTWSWQDVGAELPWIEMLANHLRAFR
jgi:hypothetical protein